MNKEKQVIDYIYRLHKAMILITFIIAIIFSILSICDILPVPIAFLIGFGLSGFIAPRLAKKLVKETNV